MSNYKLDVSEAEFTVATPHIDHALRTLVKLILIEEITVNYNGMVTLEQGDPLWGVQHINNKFTNMLQPITNDEISKALCSIFSTHSFFYVKEHEGQPYSTYQCIVILYIPDMEVPTSWPWELFNVFTVTIGIPPTYIPDDTTYLTILSADLAYVEEDDPREEEIEVYETIVYAPLLGASYNLINAPSQIAEGPLDLYRSGLNDYVQDLTDDSAEDAVDSLLTGTIIGTIITLIDTQILTYCAHGSTLYYVAWATVITAIIALLVVIIIGLIALFNWIAAAEVTTILVSKVPDIVAALAVVWGTTAKSFEKVPDPCYYSVLHSLNSNPLLPSQTPNSDLFDDDNDGIPNTVERFYFDREIRGTSLEANYNYPNADILWLLPDEDYDDDGLNTMTELIFNADPFEQDTDGDGLLDQQEVVVHGEGSITLQAYFTDHDRDGVLDVQTIKRQGTSIEYKSNPSLCDSDDDGLDDYSEIFTHNTLPTDSDIDGDGLTNYEEIYGVYDFNGDGDYDDPGEYTGYHTEPSQFDTDGDGYGDGYEIDPNLPYDPSDPTDPNSIPSVGGGGGGFF